MSAPLQIEHLTKSYGSLCAACDVSFEVQEGEIFGLLGPNGAGKTTIIKTIVGMEKPDKGSIQVYGHDIVKNPRQAKSYTGIVQQEIVNHGYFSVYEVMGFYSGYFGIRNNAQHIEYLLRRLALWEHRHKKVKQLSGGMKRRLMIAKSLCNHPKLLLLDEPTAGVDIELRANLWDFVRDLRDEGVSILLTTHYLEEAEELCDRIGVIHKGQIRRVGETRGLIREFTKRQFVIHLRMPVDPIEYPGLVSQTETEIVVSTAASLGAGDLLDELKIDLRLIRDISHSRRATRRRV